MDLKLTFSNKFDLQNAYTLCYCAKLVYEDYLNIKKSLKKYKLYWFNSKGTQAIIIETEKDIILACRGTEPNNIKDWYTNIRIQQRKTPYGGIHEGFWEAWRNIADDILKIEFSKPIWFTGHSQGATIATIASVELTKYGKCKEKGNIYTFGAPRIGNARFVRNIKATGIPYFRLVNNNDVVPLVPPLTIGYRHCKELIYIDSNGNIYEGEKAINWWKILLDRISGRVKSLGDNLLEGINDHKIENYFKILKKNIKGGI